MKALFLSKLRQAQVFGMTMTELILSLLFILLFATLPKSEAGLDNPEELRNIINQQKTEILQLKNQMEKSNEELKGVKNILWDLLKKLKIPLETSTSNENIIKVMVGYDILVAKKKEEGKGERGGTGKQNCLGGKEYLLSIIMFNDGYEVKKEWTDSNKNNISPIKEINSMIDGGRINNKAYNSYAEAIFMESDRNECRYHVKVYDQTTTKEGYIRQLDNIEKIFYIKKIK